VIPAGQLGRTDGRTQQVSLYDQLFTTIRLVSFAMRPFFAATIAVPLRLSSTIWGSRSLLLRIVRLVLRERTTAVSCGVRIPRLSSARLVSSCAWHYVCVSSSSCGKTASAGRVAGSAVLCMVYSNGTAVERCVVHLSQCLVGFFLGRKSDESESTTSIRISIFDNHRLLDIAKALEAFVQRIVGCVPGEASDEELCHDGYETREEECSLTVDGLTLKTTRESGL